MDTISFFHNEREDNGKRTGVSVNGERALERYVPGDEDRNPGLRWYFDIVYPTNSPPATQESAMNWFAEHVDSIKSSLEFAANKLENGIDADQIPWSFERQTADGPVRVTVSAMRRYDALNIANRIRQFMKGEWQEFVSHPDPVD